MKIDNFETRLDIYRELEKYTEYQLIPGFYHDLLFRYIFGSTMFYYNRKEDTICSMINLINLGLNICISKLSEMIKSREWASYILYDRMEEHQSNFVIWWSQSEEILLNLCTDEIRYSYLEHIESKIRQHFSYNKSRRIVISYQLNNLEFIHRKY